MLIEIYKVKMGLSLSSTNDTLSLGHNASCNLRAGVTMTRRNIRSNRFDFETVGTTGSISWGSKKCN